jgi:hypothetical protein
VNAFKPLFLLFRVPVALPASTAAATYCYDCCDEGFNFRSKQFGFVDQLDELVFGVGV